MQKVIWQESTPEQKVILITLLMMANHKGKEWEWKGKSYKAKPGQFITSIPSIAKRAGKGISVQNVRTALKRFKKYEFLTDESTNQNRLVTIVNWESYQSEHNEANNQANSQLTGTQQTPNRPLTSNKNDKNDKNKRNNIIVLNPEEAQFLKVLESIENYPVDRIKDLGMLERLKERYPSLDLIESIKDFAIYKQDNPIRAKDNPRSQINTSFKKYVQWNKNLKGSNDYKSQGDKPKELYQVDSS